MGVQEKLFEDIKKQLSHNQLLVNEVSDVLGISSDASYRRIRGNKELSATELIRLCTHFNISMDDISGNNDNHLIFRYNPLDLINFNSYYAYIKNFAESITALSKVKDKEIYYTAEDIPIFHFLPYRELTLFKVYAWYIAVSNEKIGFKQFIEEIENKNELFACYDRIKKSYDRIPSTEIWTESTIDPLLQSIEYYYDTEALGGSNMATMLCDQLLSMIKNVKEWAETGIKNEAGNYRLFATPVHSNICFILFKKDGIYSSVTIRLYTTNGINTTNPVFCAETEKWVNNIIAKSTLLSGTSARERNAFFKNTESKILKIRNKVRKR